MTRLGLSKHSHPISKADICVIGGYRCKWSKRMGSGEIKPPCILYLPVCWCVPSSPQRCYRTPLFCDSGWLMFWSCCSFLSRSRWLNVGMINPHSNKQPFGQKVSLLPSPSLCPVAPAVPLSMARLTLLLLPTSGCASAQTWPSSPKSGLGVECFSFWIIRCIHGTLWMLTATTQPHPFTARAWSEPRQKIMGL